MRWSAGAFIAYLVACSITKDRSTQSGTCEHKSDLSKGQLGSYNTGLKYHYVAVLCKGRHVLGKMILSFPYTH